MNGSFGKFIEEKRKAYGMTLRGLAAELGIAPAFMSDIEKGQRYPPNKEEITGLGWHPWLYRYVGEGIAGSIHSLGITLEEYLSLFYSDEAQVVYDGS